MNDGEEANENGKECDTSNYSGAIQKIDMDIGIGLYDVLNGEQDDKKG